jgi:hypothetical protein
VKLLEEYVHSVERWGGSFGSGSFGSGSLGSGSGDSETLVLTNIARMMFYCNQKTLEDFSPAHRDVESIIPPAMNMVDSSIQDPSGADERVPVLKIVNKKRHVPARRKSSKKSRDSVLTAIEDEPHQQEDPPVAVQQEDPPVAVQQEDPPVAGEGSSVRVPQSVCVRVRVPGGGEDYSDNYEEVSS